MEEEKGRVEIEEKVKVQEESKRIGRNNRNMKRGKKVLDYLR